MDLCSHWSGSPVLYSLLRTWATQLEGRLSHRALTRLVQQPALGPSSPCDITCISVRDTIYVLLGYKMTFRACVT